MNNDQRSIAELILEIIAPALIMLLVGSFVTFLVEVFYHGQFTTRISVILALFTFAAVLIGRISIQQDHSVASLYAIPLGLVTLLAMIRFVEINGPMASLSLPINIFLIAFIWYFTHKLVWDCTFVDLTKDVSAKGLLDSVGARWHRLREAFYDIDQQADGEPSARTQPSQTQVSSDQNPLAPLLKWFKNRKANTPGLWIVYFSLFALPVFGLAQGFIPASEVASRQWVFQLFVVYILSALGLLMTTSLIGLMRYLHSRSVEMPNSVMISWLSIGTAAGVLLLFLAWLLPRPAPEYSVARAIPNLFDTPDSTRPSNWGLGNDGRDAGGKATRSGPQGQSGQSKSGQSKSGQSKSGQGKSGQGKSGQGKSGQGKSGQGKSGQGKSGQGKSGQSKSGQGKSGQSKSGQSKSGQSKSGQGKSGQGKSGQSKSGQSKSGQSKSGQSKSGQGKSGQSKSGQSKSGQSKSGQGKSGQSKSGQSKSEQGKSGQGKSGQSKSGQSKSGQSKSEQENNSGASRSGGTRMGDQSDRNRNSSSETSSKSNSTPSTSNGSTFQLPPVLSSIGTLIKIIAALALVALLVWCAYRYHREIRKALRDWWEGLVRWWSLFVGRKSRERKTASNVPAAPVIPRRAFASFKNPFRSGRRSSPSAEELVAYTFSALEAWAHEAGHPRREDQTPIEFAKTLSHKIPAVSQSAKKFTEWVNQSAYAPGTLNSTCLADVEAMWQVMEKQRVLPVPATA